MSLDKSIGVLDVYGDAVRENEEKVSAVIRQIIQHSV